MKITVKKENKLIGRHRPASQGEAQLEERDSLDSVEKKGKIPGMTVHTLHLSLQKGEAGRSL